MRQTKPLYRITWIALALAVLIALSGSVGAQSPSNCTGGPCPKTEAKGNAASDLPGNPDPKFPMPKADCTKCQPIVDKINSKQESVKFLKNKLPAFKVQQRILEKSISNLNNITTKLSGEIGLLEVQLENYSGLLTISEEQIARSEEYHREHFGGRKLDVIELRKLDRLIDGLKLLRTEKAEWESLKASHQAKLKKPREEKRKAKRKLDDERREYAIVKQNILEITNQINKLNADIKNLRIKLINCNKKCPTEKSDCGLPIQLTKPTTPQQPTCTGGACTETPIGPIAAPVQTEYRMRGQAICNTASDQTAACDEGSGGIATLPPACTAGACDQASPPPPPDCTAGACDQASQPPPPDCTAGACPETAMPPPECTGGDCPKTAMPPPECTGGACPETAMPPPESAGFTCPPLGQAALTPTVFGETGSECIAPKPDSFQTFYSNYTKMNEQKARQLAEATFAPLTVGANSEVGSGAKLKEKVTETVGGMLGGMLGGGGGGGGGGGFGGLPGMGGGGGGFGGLPGMGGGGLPGMGGGGGGGDKEPQLADDPVSDDNKILLTDAATGTKIKVGMVPTPDGIRVSSTIVEAPGDGTFQTIYMQDPEGRKAGPTDYDLYELYQDWKLTVTWTYDRWVDGEHVEHKEGGWSEEGRNILGTFTIPREKDGLWSKLGFSTAVQGVKSLGTLFPISKEFLQNTPMTMVIHVTQPDKDPVTTVPFVIGVLPPC